MVGYSRRASHAGPSGQGWYDSSCRVLKDLVDNLFASVAASTGGGHSTRLCGIISPHAGVAYSGTTAAHVYLALQRHMYGADGESVRNVFILGPSHHKGFRGVELSAATLYETPFGAVRVDAEMLKGLLASLTAAGVPASLTTRSVDEDEHSIEMQMPFLSHVLHHPPSPTVTPAATRVSIVPIVVGWVNEDLESRIASVLQDHFGSPSSLFIFSSDFCHWGSRFQYNYHYQKATYPQIGDAVIAMDKEGMRLLEQQRLREWYHYLDTTGNTICGRHPISVAMQMITAKSNNSNYTVSFAHYSQSNRCASPTDSSVSYASAVITKAA